MKKILTILLLLNGLICYTQDFVYEPVNPSFGGSYLNYSWLLGSAEAQNSFSDPSRLETRYADDNLQDFEESLQRQILNQLARELTQNQFGSDGITEGYYEVGTYQIDITSNLDGSVINIIDASTGNETTITIPYY